ncbi:MAG: uroporphyrinogen-III synthase [Deltaproteobacteria bacterium]|nr:uroporphyrinogen-III synthase [Candidatus Anaeroferrophillacea bacterium]
MQETDKKKSGSLAGLRVLVTRPRHQAAPFIALLEQAGAVPLVVPTIAIVAPASWAAADTAITRLESYDWLIFTSVNGVHFFLRRIEEQGGSPAALRGRRIMCIGPKTAAALAEFGIDTRVQPERYQAEGLLEALNGTTAGLRFLLPRAETAREILPETLRERGATVDVIPVYRAVFPPDSARRLDALLDGTEAPPELLTFTSSSTVGNLVNYCAGHEPGQRLLQIPAACIGPVTARTARDAGLDVRVEADEFTIEGLLEAIREWAAGGAGEQRR